MNNRKLSLKNKVFLPIDSYYVFFPIHNPMNGISTITMPGYCPYCSNHPYSYMVHQGICPRIQSIEYYPNGKIHKVEFNDPGYFVNKIGNFEWPE